MAIEIIKLFLRLFDTEPQQPWLNKGDIYLLHVFIHLQQNIRTKLLTEKIGKLAFYAIGNKELAKWSQLLQLYKLEEEGLV